MLTGTVSEAAGKHLAVVDLVVVVVPLHFARLVANSALSRSILVGALRADGSTGVIVHLVQV